MFVLIPCYGGLKDPTQFQWIMCLQTFKKHVKA